jgi:flagellar basal body-associated protein FliL
MLSTLEKKTQISEKLKSAINFQLKYGYGIVKTYFKQVIL